MKMNSRLRRFGVTFALATGAAVAFAPLSSAQRFSEWSTPANLGSTINTVSFEG